MFDIHNYISFLMAIILFQIIPGPGTVAILNATARGGIGDGFNAVAGTLLADFLYMLGAVLGLAAVIFAYPKAFTILQWCGVIYLCWLGFRLLTSSNIDGNKRVGKEKRRYVYFRQAFMIGLTNPKVMLFFMAFFPLFLSVHASIPTLVIMMMHVTVMSFIYQAGLTVVGSSVACRLSAAPWACRLARQFAGIALISFGVKLAVNNR